VILIGTETGVVMNPLIEKFEEVYGKKPKEGGLIDHLAGEDTINFGSHLLGGEGQDVISFGNMGDTNILSGGYVDSSMLNLNPAYISNVNPNIKNHAIPNQTSVEQQFNKVLEDVGRGKATVSAISADIDQSFVGFGGQIKYTVEIIGRYP